MCSMNEFLHTAKYSRYLFLYRRRVSQVTTHLQSLFAMPAAAPTPLCCSTEGPSHLVTVSLLLLLYFLFLMLFLCLMP